MTTKDVGIGGEGMSVSLSNGLFGAATQALGAKQAACRSNGRGWLWWPRCSQSAQAGGAERA